MALHVELREAGRESGTELTPTGGMSPSFLSFVRLKFGKIGTERQMARHTKGNVRATVCATCPCRTGEKKQGQRPRKLGSPWQSPGPAPFPAALETETRAGEEAVKGKFRMVWADLGIMG